MSLFDVTVHDYEDFGAVDNEVVVEVLGYEIIVVNYNQDGKIPEVYWRKDDEKPRGRLL